MGGYSFKKSLFFPTLAMSIEKWLNATKQICEAAKVAYLRLSLDAFGYLWLPFVPPTYQLSIEKWLNSTKQICL